MASGRTPVEGPRGVIHLSTLSFPFCKRERAVINSAFLRGACRAQRDDACEALGAGT